MRNSSVKKREKKPKSGEYFDYNLLAVMILLICFGLVILYSASAYSASVDPSINDDMFYLKKQAAFSLVALVAALLISRMNYHFFLKLAPLLYLLALVAMAMVKTGLGVTAGGARRWLSIGGVRFQPSEIAKIAVILFLTYIVLRMGRKVESRKAVGVLLLLGGLQALAAYYFTENLSTALIILAISCAMIFLSHPRTKIFLIIFAGVAVLAAGGLYLLTHYLESSKLFRIRRILVWANPEKYAADGGYQVLQGLYAIGSGGFFGKGLGNGTQKLSIPEAQNDMIFAVVCEELGLFGAILLLLLFGYLLYRLLVIAQNAPDLYGTLIVSGIFVHISLQVILNICVVLNVIPTTGVTLPFISYGGTSLLFLAGEIGMALGVSRKIGIRDSKEARTK